MLVAVELLEDFYSRSEGAEDLKVSDRVCECNVKITVVSVESDVPKVSELCTSVNSDLIVCTLVAHE